MPQQLVFPCPSCGASLSANPTASTVQCQFCGTTSAIPQSLRSYGAPLSPDLPGAMGSSPDPSQLSAIGDAVRANNTGEAIRLYREQFSASQTEAQEAVFKLAAGQSVRVGTLPNGQPQYLQVSAQAPAAPYYVPMMTPAIPDGNKIFKGVMGFNIALTLAIFGFTACIFLFVFAAVGLAFVPFFGSFGSLFGH
jgi:hypothetical protein